MKTNTGHDRRFIIAKNLIMMHVVLVVGLLAVWSWFTVNKKVEANNICVKAEYPNDIGLAEVQRDADGNDLGPDIFKGELNFYTDVKLTKDCTGDGETLIVPSFSVIKDKDTATKKGREVNIGGTWEEALSQTEVEKIKNVNPDFEGEPRYIEYEFYARSKTKGIKLSTGSYLSASDEHLNSDLNNPDNVPVSKRSAYSSAPNYFSVDSIVGAARVALIACGVRVEQNYTTSGNNVIVTNNIDYINSHGDTNVPQLTCLWLPRPDLKMNVSQTGLTTDWTLQRGIVHDNSTPDPPTDNADNDITYFHTYYKPASTGSTKSYDYKWNTNSTQLSFTKREGVVVEKKLAGDNEGFVATSKSTVSNNTYPTFGKEEDVADVSETDNLETSTLRKDASNPSSETSYYVFKYKLRIWLEGEDTESRRAMDGGQFSLHLEFR